MHFYINAQQKGDEIHIVYEFQTSLTLTFIMLFSNQGDEYVLERTLVPDKMNLILSEHMITEDDYKRGYVDIIATLSYIQHDQLITYEACRVVHVHKITDDYQHTWLY